MYNIKNIINDSKLKEFSKVLLHIYFFSLIISNTLAQGIAGTLTVILLLRLIITRGMCFNRTPLDIFFAVFLITRFVSTFITYDPLTAMEIAGRRILLYSIYFVITNTYEFNNIYQTTTRSIMLLVFSCVLGSFHAYYEFMIEEIVRPGSFAGGYSRLAEFSSITLILSAFLKNNRNVFIKNYIFIPIFIIILSILIITQSRAAWVGTFLGLLILVIKGDKKIILFFIVIFGLALAGLPTIRDRALTLLNPAQHTSGRDIIWREAFDRLMERPIFGHGVKSMKLIASPDIKKFGTWHSDYLQIAMESGFAGLAAYLVLSFFMFYKCIKLLRVCSGEEKDVIYGITACFVSMYFISFFGGHIVEPVLSLLFFSLIGIISVYSLKLSH